MHVLFSILSGLITLGAYVPYTIDILKGKVYPARSTRLMFVMLLAIALLQQRALGAGLALGVTVGELVGAVISYVLSLKHGVGGLRRMDLACYALVAVSVGIWILSGNALLSLCFGIVADTIAFFPTMHKTWQHPSSETSLFYILGVIGALCSVAAARTFTLGHVLYPAYLAIINIFEIVLINRSPTGSKSVDK